MVGQNDSIAAIGASPLGTMGLNYGGIYGSYMDPMSMAAMSGGINGMGGLGGFGGMGAMGGLGMYNPAFMQQMISAQQNIEKQQVVHSADMHDALMQAEVTNLSAHDRAIFQKISVDGDVQRGIRILATAVQQGDSDSIMIEYDKLKSLIYSKFASDFKNNLSGNASLNADRYIEMMYSQIVSKQVGRPVDLRDDIRRYGESAFMNGFNSSFLGNKGHNKHYSEEVISYIDGKTRINDQGSKNRAQKWGGYAEKAVEGAGALGAGYIAGWGLLGLTKLLPFVNIPFFKYAKNAGKFGGAALLAADIWWQMTRENA